MRRRHNFRAAAVLAGLLGAASWGCGGATVPSAAVLQARPLEEVGAMYRTFTADRRKPPTTLKDFLSYREMSPEGYSAIKDGKVQVVWGVPLSDLSEAGGNGDPADEVLAYETKVPDQGGAVLMRDRTVRTMTADAFKAAPRAPGKTDEAKAKAK